MLVICVCACLCVCVCVCVCVWCHCHQLFTTAHASFPASEERVRSGIKKLSKGMQGATQGRLDSFFKVMPAPAKAVKRPVSLCQHTCTLTRCYYSYSLHALLQRAYCRQDPRTHLLAKRQRREKQNRLNDSCRCVSVCVCAASMNVIQLRSSARSGTRVCSLQCWPTVCVGSC